MLYLDILDASEARVGTGPIPVISWESTKRLSRAGAWQAEVPAQHPRLIEATSKRRVRCYRFGSDGVRVIGEGIIDERQTRIGTNGTTVVLGGDDLLAELGYRLIFAELSVVTSYTPRCGFVTSGGTWFFWDGDEESPEMLIEEQDSYLFVGLEETTFNRIDFDMDLTNVAQTDLNLGVSDERGDGQYRAPEDVTDTTDNAGAPLGQDGYIAFTRPASWFRRDLQDEGATSDEGELYWVRFDPEATMGRDDPEEPTLGIRIDGIVVKSITPRLDDISYLITFAPSGWTLNPVYYTSTADGTLKKIDGETLLAVYVAISEQTGEQFRLGSGRQVEWLREYQPNSGIVALQAFGVPVGIEGDYSGLVSDPPPMPTPPAAPTGLTAVPTGTNNLQVVLNWTLNDELETGTIVEYSVNGSSWLELTTTAAGVETYTHTTPTYGEVTHYYRVRTENEYGESANATTTIAGLLLGLVAYWALSDTGIWADSVGANDLTEHGSVTSEVGVIGNAAKFNTSDPAYLSLASTAAVEMGDINYTFSAWSKPGNPAAETIFCKDDPGVNSEWGVFAIDTDLYFHAYRAGGGDVVHLAANSFTSSAYHHIIAYHDADNNQIGARLNGGSVTTAAMSGSHVAPTAEPFYVGHRNGGLNSSGGVQALGIWKRLLSENEQQALTNAGAGLAYPF